MKESNIMKKRVIKKGNWWYGEVYGNWNSILFGEWTGWEEVTSNCYTSWGAKLALEKWIHENIPIEYEI